ncbi:MAG: SDR family NAD(P)-dependent oxidoreductase, partial [Nitrososphaerales archaeon]
MGGRFEGRVALVTGAAGGLGQASAQLLAAEGAHVIAVDIDGARLAGIVEGLATESLAVEIDVADEAAVDRCIDLGVAAFGHIDCHHLNAGVFGSFAAIPDLPAEEFDRVIAVNLRGQFLGLRAAFR